MNRAEAKATMEADIGAAEVLEEYGMGPLTKEH